LGLLSEASLALFSFAKDSPQEIGFVIGGLVGLVWVIWTTSNRGGGRGAGAANYILIMICGGIGSGIGWLVSRLFLLLG
jgi:hypothetical protein